MDYEVGFHRFSSRPDRKNNFITFSFREGFFFLDTIKCHLITELITKRVQSNGYSIV